MSELSDRVAGYREGWNDAKAEATPRIEQLEAALREARQLVTEANNSLYGSQGYFHSLNGGPFNKYHLAEGIETLKAQSNRNYHRIEQLEAALRDIIANDPAYIPPRIRQIVRAALDQSSPRTASCSGCAGITHTHTCGDPAKQPQLDSSPPARQENDDVYPGFRGNNEA